MKGTKILNAEQLPAARCDLHSSWPAIPSVCDKDIGLHHHSLPSIPPLFLVNPSDTPHFSQILCLPPGRFYKNFINRTNCNTCHFVCKACSGRIVIILPVSVIVHRICKRQGLHSPVVLRKLQWTQSCEISACLILWYIRRTQMLHEFPVKIMRR